MGLGSIFTAIFGGGLPSPNTMPPSPTQRAFSNPEPERKGERLAARRLVEHRRRWKGIRVDGTETRQQRRARLRAAAKAERSAMKAAARKAGQQGLRERRRAKLEAAGLAAAEHVAG